MPLHAIRARATTALWGAFGEAFLGDLGDRTGPDGYPAQAWLTHRVQRDRLYREAAARALRGWLNPPVAFFSDLPRLFDIRQRPVGLAERQVHLDRLATQHAAGRPLLGAHAPGTFDRPGLGRAVDHVLGELLPEGVSPDQLEAALDALPADGFAHQRNEWLALVFRDYLAALEQRDRYDPRAIHALVAGRIAAGGLPAALRGARRLHIYGLVTTRTRGRLLQALAEQPDVEVVLYLLEDEATAGEWKEFAVRVQPVPDEHRELEFVALQAKKLILEQGVRPDEIAVVARTGREDARLAFEILSRAGLPATARVRSALAEVPALKAVLQLLRAAALDWPYRPLRHVLESSYFDVHVDLRALDYLAAQRRYASLDGWIKALEELERRIGTGEDDDPEREGLVKDRLKKDRDALVAFASQARTLADPRPIAEWLRITRELLDPGWFRFRQRICRDDGGRWDLVRLDQQGVEAVGALLAQWHDVGADPAPLTSADWYARFRRLLAANEIALSTPLRTGIQVLEAHEAALVPFAHTFLVHANDGEFPKSPGPGWLFTDLERRALAGGAGAAGAGSIPPLQHRDLTLARERALWRAVTAGPATTITYRTADANGVPLLPSLLVPEHDQSDEIPRTRFIWPEPFNAHHADRTALDRVLRTIASTGEATAPRVLPVRLAILRGRAESVRLVGAGLIPPLRRDGWNGWLRDPRVLEKLAEQFGPERVWSASQLESYSQNPFVFMVERVLWLDEVLEADEDVNPMAWGGVAHRVLERFHRVAAGFIPAVGAGFIPPLREFTGDAAALFDRVFEEVQAELDAGDTWLGLPAVWRARRRGMRRVLEEFLAWELPRLKGWTPDQFELGFGSDGEAPFMIAGHDLAGRTAELRLRGRIDRVDSDGKGGSRVVDYKSGGIPENKGYEDGAALQGPLYLAAIRALGMTPVEAAYLSIRQKKLGAVIAWGSPVCEGALRMAFSIPERVRSGRFEPSAAESCEWKDWWPGGLALFRCAAVLEGCRFDE